jgi:hypothetical protein
MSPDHAVLVDGMLIPVKYLLNGSSVVRVRCATVSYYHVALPHHDVLLAEGLAVESLLAAAGCGDFSSDGDPAGLHPDFHARAWEAAGCAPLVIAGAKLAAVRARLARPQLAARRDSTRFQPITTESPAASG